MNHKHAVHTYCSKYVVIQYNTIIFHMYRGILSEDEYGTQQFLADLRFKTVTVEIDPVTNDLYDIESNTYDFSRI